MRAWIEPQSKIEILRRFRDRVDHNSPNAYRIRCLRHSLGCVAKQSAPDTAPLPIQIHCQTRQHGYRNRVWHVSSESTRSALPCDRTRRQRIKADYVAAFANYVRSRGAAHMISARPPLQPLVERCFAGMKIS